MAPAADSSRPIVIGVALLVAAALLWAVRNLVVLVALSMLLAYALEPAVSALARVPLPRGARVPRGVAAGLVMLLLFAAVAASVVVASPRLGAQLAGFVERLPSNVSSVLEAVRTWAVERGLGAYVEPVIETLRGSADELVRTAGAAALGGIGRVFGGLGDVLGLLLLPLLAFYLLADREAVTTSALAMLPRGARTRFERLRPAVERALRSYVRGQAVVCLVMGTAVGILLALAGIPLALLLGVVVGLAEIVPYLGFTLASIAVALVGYGVSPGHAVLAFALYAVTNALIGWLVTPRVMGRHLKLHPFVVTVSVLAGATLLGPAGVLVALPGAAVLKAAMEARTPGAARTA